MSSPSTDFEISQFYRHEYGRVLAHLTHKFGTAHIEQVEDAVQEAMYKAMQAWPSQGIPISPAGWIVRTAQNFMLDGLRRQQNFDQKHAQEWLRRGGESMEETVLDEELNDDQLRMMFACCHPSLGEESQLYLTLKILGGFTNREVARALLKQEEAVAKGYTRAKKHLRDAGVHLEVPLGAGLMARLDQVLRVIYLLFNEGYNATAGEQLVRTDLCEEAMRLTQLLLDHALLRKPQVHGLMALMLFQTSRFPARQDGLGNLLTLENQDRSLWDQEMITKANHHLDLATAFGQMHDYILQAGMASIHAMAATFAQTNWHALLGLYTLQVKRNPNPVIRLNRVVVLQRALGASEALAELDALSAFPTMQRYYLYHAIRADVLLDLGANDSARETLRVAMDLTANTRERQFLVEKMAQIPG